MLLTVYDSNRQAKAVLSPDDSSTQVKAIQSDNILTLSFTLYEYVALEVNDYVDFESERYWLQERYLPDERSTQEWKYDVKFYGIESLMTFPRPERGGRRPGTGVHADRPAPGTHGPDPEVHQ